MIFLTDRKDFRNIFILITMFFILGGVVSVFSQVILATFGAGGEFFAYDDRTRKLGTSSDETVAEGTLIGVNILFIGKTGFTISSGIDWKYKMNEGANIDPVLGFGYVYYDNFYFGGIFNIILKPYIRYNIRQSGAGYYWDFGDGFLTPTLVGGYDFGHFSLGGLLSYMYGTMSKISGFRFLLGVGINVGPQQRTPRTNRAAEQRALAAEINTQIEEHNIADAHASVTSEGVSINLSNIQFLADSAVLTEAERQRLREIARILTAVPAGRKIQIAGHSALAGSRESQIEISRDRAQAVADFLVSLGARSREEINVVGYGSDRPIANNSTPEGMAANRRVEITILDN